MQTGDEEERVDSTRCGTPWRGATQMTGVNGSHSQSLSWGLTDPVARPTASQQDPTVEQDPSLVGDSREEYRKGSGEWDAG